MSLKKKDQDAIASLYLESVGYNGETNDNYSDSSDQSLDDLHTQLHDIRTKQSLLNKQIKQLEEYSYQNSEIENELLQQIKKLDPDFYEG